MKHHHASNTLHSLANPFPRHTVKMTGLVWRGKIPLNPLLPNIQTSLIKHFTYHSSKNTTTLLKDPFVLNAHEMQRKHFCPGNVKIISCKTRTPFISKINHVPRGGDLVDCEGK